jgi:hypothetical protein
MGFHSRLEGEGLLSRYREAVIAEGEHRMLKFIFQERYLKDI